MPPKKIRILIKPNWFEIYEYDEKLLRKIFEHSTGDTTVWFVNPEIFIEDIPLEDFEQALQKDGAKTLIALRKKERRNRDLNPNLAVVIEKFEERYDENLGIEEIWKREREDWKRNKKRRKK